MNFIKYNLVLLLSGFPAILLFSLGVVVCFAPLTLFFKTQKPPMVIVIPLALLAGAFQIYFWGLWSAYCVATTYKFTLRPFVTWNWLYFVTGFFEASSLIWWLNHKEKQGETYEQQRGTQKGSMYYATVAWIAYIVFAIWPSLIIPVYGWATDLLDITKYISPIKYSDTEYHLTDKDKEILKDRPGDEIVPYSLDKERKAQLERKIETLAKLTGTPREMIETQYYAAIEHVFGTNLDRLQAGVWQILQEGGMPSKLAKRHSKLDCLVFITSKEMQSDGTLSITYENLNELLDSQIKRFSK